MATEIYYSREDADNGIDHFQQESFSKYAVTKSVNFQRTDVSDLSEFKIRWEDKSYAPEIPFEGIPFIILGSQTRSCHQGPLRNRAKQHSGIDHEYLKSRKQNQCSKKLGCKANVIIRSILLFPDYKVDFDSAGDKKRKRDELVRTFSPDTKRILKLFVKYPESGDHTGHLKDELATYVMGPDRVVIHKIHELVGNGIHKVPDIKLHLQMMAKDLYPHITPTDRRFYPTDKDIRNHVYNALTESRYSANDQDNLRINIAKWKESHPEDKFFYRPVTSDENDKLKSKNFLFIHQTSFQKDLILKYGQEISLMDATYNTTLYDLPLFFICVPTNVGFSIVATFVLGKESTTNIAEALGILKTWNAGWKPQHFMCDFDWREINALESVFEDCFVYLCTFHREQCWGRWLSKSSNGCSDKKSEILAMLRSIADSMTEEEYSANLENLRTSTVFIGSSILQAYLEKTWIKHHKRWVFAFRTNLFNVKLNTTNGLERKHRDIKENYLKKHALGKTLVGMVDAVIGDYLPDCQQRYKRYNIESLSQCKVYDKSIPNFLKDRPKRFLNHCMERLERTFDYYVTSKGSSFEVTNIQSGQNHMVNLTESNNLCDCKDFKSSHWPCKHLLKVLIKDGSDSCCWYQLPEEYINNVFFNIDHQCLLPIPPFEGNNHPVHNDLVQVEEDIDASLINTLKNIQSGIYNVDNCEVKTGILKILKDIDNMVTKYQSKKDDLPLRHQLSRKSTKKKRNVRVKGMVDETNCTITSGESCVDVDDLVKMEEVSKVITDYQLKEITLEDIMEIDDSESSSSPKKIRLL